VRLHEAEEHLMRKHQKATGQLRTPDEDLFEDKVTWMLRGDDLYCYSTATQDHLIVYGRSNGLLTLRATDLDERTRLNNALPEGLSVKSIKRGRWVITGLDNARQVPFHNSVMLQDLRHRVMPEPTEGWSVRNPLPYPDKTHIPKAIQKMVKTWAGKYGTPASNHGACGLCIAQNEGLMEFDIPSHLLEHILSGTLPFVMMDTIIRETVEGAGRLIQRFDVTPFRQACYQIAVAYAYKTLRSTYA